MNSKSDYQNRVYLPEYLEELLEIRPSGITKLIAAWDGLNTESQIMILTEIRRRNLPRYFTDKVHVKALESKSPYVRYLAAKQFSFFDTDDADKKAIKKRIEEDSDDLVKYSLLELGLFGFSDKDLNDPDAFFKLSQPARLAKVRCLKCSGKEIANLILYALDHQLKDKSVSENELFEILLDYTGNAEFKKHYTNQVLRYDGFGEYLKGEGFEALWQLVPKLPYACAYVLVENLPPKAGLSQGIPEDVLKKLTDWQIENLLYRKDIILKKLRKQLFFETHQKADSIIDVRRAAISHNFNLTYQEFGEILKKPSKEKVKILADLTS
ncbi:MAG: hypothetical protein NTW55_00410 [Planctomycetota bacterium]|nr:hypothetical protein [Planctomycetota bacterium]